MITTKGLSFDYPEGDSFAFPDIALEEKSTLLILGPSGIGKNHLAPSFVAYLPPKSGEIYIDGTDVTALNRKALICLEGKNIGVIFQHYHYIKSLTVEENLKLRQLFP